jgi:hypothetical protein
MTNYCNNFPFISNFLNTFPFKLHPIDNEQIELFQQNAFNCAEDYHYNLINDGKISLKILD